MKNLGKYLFESEELEETILNEDELNEDERTNDTTMTDEDLKVESLKIATNIAKLMSDVTTDDIISIAGKVSDFIRNHNIGEETKDSKEKSLEDEDINFEVPEADNEK